LSPWEKENSVQVESKMASNGSGRGGLLSAGGVLIIIAGLSQLISAVSLAVVVLLPGYLRFSVFKMMFLPFLPDVWREAIEFGPAAIMVGCIGVLGVLAIAGGIHAIRRKSVGMSLAGAISALLSGLFGILAIIFIALGKREFGTVRV
jgi:hypothetical protein